MQFQQHSQTDVSCVCVCVCVCVWETTSTHTHTHTHTQTLPQMTSIDLATTLQLCVKTFRRRERRTKCKVCAIHKEPFRGDDTHTHTHTHTHTGTHSICLYKHSHLYDSNLGHTFWFYINIFPLAVYLYLSFLNVWFSWLLLQQGCHGDKNSAGL